MSAAWTLCSNNSVVEEASEQVVAAFVSLVKGAVWGNLCSLIGYFHTGCFQTFRYVTWASSGILFSVMKKLAKWLTFFLLKQQRMPCLLWQDCCLSWDSCVQGLFSMVLLASKAATPVVLIILCLAGWVLSFGMGLVWLHCWRCSLGFSLVDGTEHSDPLV